MNYEYEEKNGVVSVRNVDDEEDKERQARALKNKKRISKISGGLICKL